MISEEPTANGPEDLGWTPQATGREPLRFPIPPGAPEKPCRSCGAPMIWITTPAGRKMPVNPDGTSHFGTCPNANDHRKPKPAPVTLTTRQAAVLRMVHDGIAVPIRNDNRFTLSDLERLKLIAMENRMRWVCTDAGKAALAPKKTRART